MKNNDILALTLTLIYIAIGTWALIDLSTVAAVPLAVSDMLICIVAIGNIYNLRNSRE